VDDARCRYVFWYEKLRMIAAEAYSAEHED
jgi:hypothetical protein